MLHPSLTGGERGGGGGGGGGRVGEGLWGCVRMKSKYVKYSMLNTVVTAITERQTAC